MKRTAPVALAAIAALGIAFGACSDRAAPAVAPDVTRTATSVAPPPGAGTASPTPAGAAGLLSIPDLVKYAEPAIVRVATGTGVGSGFVVDPAGYIVTNNHVIQGPGGRPLASVRVTMSDGAEFDATVVGADPRSDLALLKIDAGRELHALPLADLDAVQIGEDVVAIGYALDLARGEGPSFSVTRGIVSQKNRGIMESSSILGAVQTDAAINHGNSGGPLLNLRGEVVGVNTALQPDFTTGGAAQGIGYAVGSDMVRVVWQELRDQGQVTRGLLGIVGFEALRPAKARELGIPEDTGGIYLPEGVSGASSSVAVGSPAWEAGIRPGDVITTIDGAPIATEGDLAIAMIEHEPGKTVAVQVYRGGELQAFDVTLGAP